MSLQDLLSRVQRPLDELRVIAAAKCLLMELYGYDEPAAHARLRRLAMDRRQRMVEAAQSLLNQQAAC